ncbi:MAG TPA: GNAT family N-acetyltransferase [Gemmataceae bacterium]|nr:GNAT family N-acetyltransferase [Gemmataceae bacterium]
MPDPDPVSSPVPLIAGHDCATFDCGSDPLNDYLRKYALQNHQNRSARTYAALRANKVVGYYTLAAGSVARADTPDRVAKGLANHPVPVILLARLAVDRTEQGRGLGKGPLKDALARVVQAADLIGCRALLVHAKDATAKAFYEKFGFVPSPTHDLHLFLLVKDIVANLPRPT